MYGSLVFLFFITCLRFYKFKYILKSDPQDTESAQISQRQDGRIIHATYIYNLENSVPSSHQPNGFVATHALMLMMHCYALLVPVNQRMFNSTTNV